jgi:hypothetical protein
MTLAQLAMGQVSGHSTPGTFQRRLLYAALVKVTVLSVCVLWASGHSGHASGQAVVQLAESRGPTFGRYLSAAEFDTAARMAGWRSEDLPGIRAIVDCETHGTFDTQAYNADDPNGGSFGLAQLNGAQHFVAAGEDFNGRFDPVTNLRVARWLYETRGGFGGTGGWLTCTEEVGLH